MTDLPDHIARCIESAPDSAALPDAQQPDALSPAKDDAQTVDIRPTKDFSSMTFKEAKEEWLASFEGDYIRTLLEKNGCNISQASRESGIDRKYFRKLMKKYGITADASDASDSGDSDDE